jgi:hypothetical protein
VTAIAGLPKFLCVLADVCADIHDAVHRILPQERGDIGAKKQVAEPAGTRRPSPEERHVRVLAENMGAAGGNQASQYTLDHHSLTLDRHAGQFVARVFGRM